MNPSLLVFTWGRERVRGEEGEERFLEGWMDGWMNWSAFKIFSLHNSLTCVRNEILYGVFGFLVINNLLCQLFQRSRSAKNSSASYRYGLAKFEVFNFHFCNS